jgi:hypothetical protein
MGFRREDGRIISQGAPEQILYQISEAIKDATELDDSEVSEIVMGYVIDMENEVAEKHDGSITEYLRELGGGYLAEDIAQIVHETGERPVGVKSPFNTMVDRSKDFARDYLWQKYLDDRRQQEPEITHDTSDEPGQSVNDQLLEKVKQPLRKPVYEEETVGAAEAKRRAERQTWRDGQRKWHDRVIKAVSRGIKKVQQKHHQVRISRFWQSNEGRELRDQFVKNAARVAMATRRAMGANTRKVPAKSDYDNARHQLVRLMESGSISKENILKHLSKTRELAGKVAKSKNGVKADKAPGMLKVKNTLAKIDMKLDFDATLDKTKVARSKLSAQSFAFVPKKEKVDSKKSAWLSAKSAQEQDGKMKLTEKGIEVARRLKKRQEKTKSQDKNQDKDKGDGLDK